MTTPGPGSPEERPERPERSAEAETAEAAEEAETAEEAEKTEKGAEYRVSESEKLIARYEARHDVAARGHAPDPMHVQHYLAHRRSEEALRHGRPPEPREAPEFEQLEEMEEPGEREREYEKHTQWRGWFRYGGKE